MGVLRRRDGGEGRTRVPFDFQVAEGDDADELAAPVPHGQAPQRVPAHEVDGLVDVVVGPDRARFGAACRLHGRLRGVAVLRQPADDEVAVREDAAEPPLVDDQYVPDARVPHHPRRFRQ